MTQTFNPARFYCWIFPKSIQGERFIDPKRGIVFDDFPILKALIPAATRPRKAYAAALELELDESHLLYEVMQAAYDASKVHGNLRIYFRRPVAQAILLGLSDFLEKFVPVYVEEFSHSTINSKGSEWISTSVEIDPL